MKRTVPVLLIILNTFILSGQQRTRISGFVKDSASGESLIGANILEAGMLNGTSTDQNGYFSLGVNNNATLQVSFLGYITINRTFGLKKDTLVTFFLVPSTEMLNEVVINAYRQPEFNVSTITYQQMTELPSIGSKPDIIKTLTMMPGINSQSEGSSLMSVRGGDPGQNLYLIDNVPLIYVNHLGGFMSVFNPEIINNVDIYKGGFPARYGGKLSSILDITQKEGDLSHRKGSLGIGLTDISFTSEGPLKWKNTSYILTGRKTVFDVLMGLMSGLSQGNDFVIAYGFHDLNGKVTWKPNTRSTASFNIYQGDDYINYWSKHNDYGKNRVGYFWGNWLASARYNSIISPKLYMNSSLSYTRYTLRQFNKAKVTGSDTLNFYSYNKSVYSDISLRSEFKYILNDRWIMNFGLHSSVLKLIPDETYSSSDGTNFFNKDFRQF